MALNWNVEQKKISEILLTTKADKVRVILWDSLPPEDFKTIKDIGEFTVKPNGHYLPLRIANGKKLAAYARNFISDVLKQSEHLHNPSITVEEVEEDWRDK